MKVDDLLEQVEDIRREPLQICCRTPAGKVIVTVWKKQPGNTATISTLWRMI